MVRAAVQATLCAAVTACSTASPTVVRYPAAAGSRDGHAQIALPKTISDGTIAVDGRQVGRVDNGATDTVVLQRLPPGVHEIVITTSEGVRYEVHLAVAPGTIARGRAFRSAPPYPALGSPAPPLADPTARTHDGFFVRFMIGSAGFSTSASFGRDDVTLSGRGGGIALALGAAISRHLVVYGEWFGEGASGPTLEINGDQVATASDDVSASVFGIGPGIAYYTDFNLYVSGTLAISRLSLDRDRERVDHSDIGLGVSGALGKEWWISDQWGLGLAGQVYLGSMPDGDVDTSWRTVAFMLAFSATCN